VWATFLRLLFTSVYNKDNINFSYKGYSEVKSDYFSCLADMRRVNVLIIDDQALFRETLALAIDANERYKLEGEFADAYELISFLPALKPHKRYVALLDLEMPGMNGVELNQLLNRDYPNIKVIILSVHYTPSLVTRLVADGAASFLTKSCNRSELNEAIESVNQNGVYYNVQVTKIMEQNLKGDGTDPDPLVKLTEREIEVLRLICAQYNSSDIAKKLELSIRTVDRHRESLLAKTKSTNAAGLVIYAIRNNLFNPRELSI
jgi:DNA-binding NarL/FixJ family response regulator